jgi:hypothetical protein
MNWTHNNHIRYGLQIYCFFLFEHQLFSFDFLSNISLSYVLIGYMKVIYIEDLILSASPICHEGSDLGLV